MMTVPKNSLALEGVVIVLHEASHLMEELHVHYPVLDNLVLSFPIKSIPYQKI